MLGREIENRAAQDGEGKDVEDGSVDVEEIEAVPQHKEGRQQVEEQKHSLPRVPSLSPDTTTEDTAISFSVWIGFVKRRDIWMKILVKIVHNPVLWAIAVGFILTLSTAGPRFLNPSSPDYIYGLGWIFITLSWFGDCVSPLSLFAMGIWMQQEWRTLFSIPIWSAILYMTAKLILVPMIMVGLAKAVKLDDQTGRAAVLIAALPISLASFVLGSRYKVGEVVLSENVALGTILVLPTILVWNLVMDELGIFPLSE
mmetsp:Transcript_14447/g.27083  ORF Transcript_14447/g.27083 Transcript_14447/m.27083 type:complete len:256 (+) Transcript_14447:1-768(+)